MAFKRLNLITEAGVFIVKRAKDNLRSSRQHSLPVGFTVCERSDQTGKPTLTKARSDFPSLLRTIRYFDEEAQRDLIFLTNHLEGPALTVAMIYPLLWRTELFSRWIKGHLRIKHYYGTISNTVKTQIWIAVSVHLMVGIIDRELNLQGTM
jgi:hypothetical protein